MTALCFIDTETTGVHPDRQVWEVAMIRRQEDNEKEYQFFVDVDLGLADPFGLKVGRFYERHPLGRFLAGDGIDPDLEMTELGRPPAMLSKSDAAKEIARVTHSAHLVGAVPNFDAETLDPLLRRYGYLPGWHYHLIDVEALAVGYLWGLQGFRPDSQETKQIMVDATRPPWKSDELSMACGVDPPNDLDRHTALGDAKWAMRWFDAITSNRYAAFRDWERP